MSTYRKPVSTNLTCKDTSAVTTDAATGRVYYAYLDTDGIHLESFDPKPALTKYGGISIGETPFKGVLDKKFLDENVRTAAPDLRRAIRR